MFLPTVFAICTIAENQLVKALPKLAKAARSDELREAFTHHLEETKGHVNRLDECCTKLGISPKGKTCHAMKGLVEEGKEIIEKDGQSAAKDAALIGAAQKVEHYEIAGYGCVRTYAHQLGDTTSEKLLQQTLDEEGAADQKLTTLAEEVINLEAER
jgi:ferritin-like metal-binding protein YciE